jgi:hypothetical protein
MSDLETRLRADLAEIAASIAVDEGSAWAAIRSRTAGDGAGASALVPFAARRRPTRHVWVAVAALVLVAVTVTVLALRNSPAGQRTVPGSVSDPTSVGTTAPSSVGGVGLTGRMALVPTTPADLTTSVVPAALDWPGRRAHQLLARPDGSAWVRLDLDPTAATWDGAAAKVGSGVEDIRLGDIRALRFQEFTTWVTMWQRDGVTATMRSGGLDMAATGDVAATLAAGEVPEGWLATDAFAAWNTLSITDQFGIATVVRSTEQRAGADPVLAAIAEASAGAALETVEVDGGTGWLVDPVGTGVRDLPQLVWERDGMIVTVARQDASVSDLRDLAATVTIRPLEDVTIPVGGALANGAASPVLPRDVAVLEQGEASGGGRFQWLASRTRVQTGPGTETDGWCVSYADSSFPVLSPGLCGPQQGTFAGVAQTVAGTAVGVVAADVTDAWFVVNGVRADAILAPMGDVQVLRATVPVGERVSLHLVRRGAEVAGTVGPDATLMCVGCSPPVIAPPGWTMPVLGPDGVETATSAPPITAP